jgi:hypothetical protein
MKIQHYLSFTLIAVLITVIVLVSGCTYEQEGQKAGGYLNPQPTIIPGEDESYDYPKIASWLSKKDELIQSGKSFDLVMTGWVTPEEADQLRANNPDVKILAGLSLNWVWNNNDWMTFLKTVANYGKTTPIEITEDMYLHDKNGERCAFGWASEEWGQEEIYAMDPRNEKWVELITSFYKNVLDQPQHDGIIVDMVSDTNWWCQDAISDSEWVESTSAIMQKIQDLNTIDKMVIFNAGKDLADIDEFSQYMDGYLMENFMGGEVKSTFEDGLKAADSGFTVIYAMDTDDTGIKDLNRMRLGLTLSLLNDNTCFTYDFGPRDHGQAWWFPEYDADLGKPLGKYYKKGDAYYREFEKGIVVCSPDADTTVSFDNEYTDITTNVISRSYTVEKGDGRIFIK